MHASMNNVQAMWYGPDVSPCKDERAMLFPKWASLSSGRYYLHLRFARVCILSFKILNFRNHWAEIQLEIYTGP